MANFSENSDKIRQSILEGGMSSLKSRIKNVEVELATEAHCTKPKATPKYTKEDIANTMVDLYKSNIKEPTHPQLPTHDPIDRSKEKEEANTIAKRANIRALSNSLANIRNGGYAGPTTEFTPSANGDVNPGRPRAYAALTVAGTEMTLEEYEEHVNNLFEKKKGLWDNIHAKRERGEKPAKPGDKDYPKTLNVEEKSEKDPCWDGYKRKPGTKKFDKGSCVKEDVIQELKDKLLEMRDHSWQSIDKVMRVLAKENNMTPKELHKEFKSQNNGMIPDDWAKENALKEEAGHMPLNEAVAINKVGNVYDVSLMWRAHTRRLKFFWPEVGQPSQEDMQKAVEMFYPGGKLLSFYMSTLPADNQTNFMVVVPPLRESVWLPQDAWVEMTDDAAAAYEYIVTEVGEPTSPPMLSEEYDGFELWVENHDTGEEEQVVYRAGSITEDIAPAKVKHWAVWPSVYQVAEDMSGMSQKSGDKRSTESGAGMTAKGVAKYNRRTGGNLKTAVTTPPSKLKAGSKAANRRKSFCARSRGWNGERGKAARARWNC